jgi:hypothetical protein
LYIFDADSENDWEIHSRNGCFSNIKDFSKCCDMDLRKYLRFPDILNKKLVL